MDGSLSKFVIWHLIILYFVFIILCLYIVVAVPETESDIEKTGALVNITLAGFAAINVDANGWSSAGVTPAIDMAIDDINARPDILPGYRLQWIVRDSQCERGMAIKQLYSHLNTPPVKLMIIGGGCSTAMEPIAEVSKYYNLVQVAYSTSSPNLSNRKVYSKFFRTSPSSVDLNQPLATLLLEFNWRRVITISEDLPSFSTFQSSTNDCLEKNNITVLVSETFSHKKNDNLEKVKEEDGRILIFNGYEGAARRIFCEAYQHEIYGVHYQWIIPGWYSKNWPEKKEDGLTCTPEQIWTAVNQSLTIDNLFRDFMGHKTISGMTYEEYEKRYLEKGRNYKDGYNDYHAYGYDAAWAISLALNASIEPLARLGKNRTGKPFRLEGFNYSSIFADFFYDGMQNVRFHGVSGEVRFDQFGDRKAPAAVGQYQGREEVEIAFYSVRNNSIIFKDDVNIMWHGHGPPLDEVSKVYSSVHIHYVLFWIGTGLSCLGVILALGFLIFNIMHMNYRHIKLSSPRLNNLIILGCILAYVSCVLFGLDSRLTDSRYLLLLCSMRTWFISLSFTLAFGSMFAKTWRVHAIFTARTVTNKALHDVHLFIFIAVLLFLEISLLLSWQFVDPLQIRQKVLSREELENIIILRTVEYCESNYQFYWVGAIYIVKGLLLLFGCFLAYETRNVRVPGLNDSKNIGMCVYNLVVMCLVGVTINVTLYDRKDISYCFTAFCIIFCSTLTLCMLFIPKIRRLRLDIADDVARRMRCNSSKAPTATFKYSMEKLSKHGRKFGSDVSEESEQDLNEKDRLIARLTERIEDLENKLKEAARTNDCNKTNDKPPATIQGLASNFYTLYGTPPSCSTTDEEMIFY